MLTSPVNVTIAANGAALKANTAISDHGTRREPPHLPAPQIQQAAPEIEPELPLNSPLTSVNAVTATVGSRTILQELTLNVATMLKLARRPDETLTSLFLRIIATIEAMPQTDRLQFEVRAGLKPLKITLADLAAALRKPDGQEAARLTALAEAPAAVPGRIAANAATTTYLEEGTDSGHTEETLAMRAAARHSAAGQSVFSAESKIRSADAQPIDEKVLQNQLKTIFEPGEPAATEQRSETAEEGPAAAEGRPIADEPANVTDSSPAPETHDAARPDVRSPMQRAPGNPGESVTFSSANLKLDPLTVEKIRTVAQSVANLAETIRTNQERAAPGKGEDHRMQTMLTFKGLAEVVAAIPAKAVELLAAVLAEAAAPLPEIADETEQLAVAPMLQALDTEQLPELALAPDQPIAENAATGAVAEEFAIETPSEDDVRAVAHPGRQAEAAMAEEYHIGADAEGMPPARPDLPQHAIPFFAYAQVQPARDHLLAAVEEGDDREGTEEDAEGESDQEDEPRRPRDEYDAIHDPLPEEDPAIVINRDSSEADRVFALYQRMGGF